MTIREILGLTYVNGQDAADLGYVNAGSDRRVGGALGRYAGRIQSALSFKSDIPPVKAVEQFGDVFLETALAPNGRQHLSIATRRGSRWLTARIGWRYDPNWGDEGTLGHNPDPHVKGGYIFDGVIKLNAPVSFIEGVE